MTEYEATTVRRAGAKLLQHTPSARSRHRALWLTAVAVFSALVWAVMIWGAQAALGNF
jgi:hypothetical protein